MAVTPSNGVYLLPSRRRPTNLSRFCEALNRAKTSTPGLILIQEDEFKDPALAEAYAALPLPESWSIRPTQGDSQGDKLREVQHLYHSGEWVGLIGDDQVVETEHWDLKLIEWLKGWNLVSCFDDDWQVHQRGGRIAGTMLWSGELFRAVGYIFPPSMHHVYLDDIWEELGRQSGCWSFQDHVRPDVLISHFHYTRGMSEKDETYTLAYDHYGQTDYGPWLDWRSNELPAAVTRVMELIARYS